METSSLPIRGFTRKILLSEQGLFLCSSLSCVSFFILLNSAPTVNLDLKTESQTQCLDHLCKAY